MITTSHPSLSNPNPGGLLRVGLVSRSLMMGGAQQHILRLCKYAPRDKVQITLFLHINDEPRDLVDEVPPDVPIVFSPHPRRSPLTLSWLVSQVRKYQIDLIHSFLWSGDAISSVAKALSPGIAFIFSERGDRGDRNLYGPLRNYFDRLLTFKVSNSCCANSHYGKTLLAQKGCRPEKINVIPNGVDLGKLDAIPSMGLRERMGWPVDARVIGIVSRLETYKGIEDLLKAAALMRRSNTYWVVLGDGSDRARLEGMLSQMGIADRFFLLGTRKPAVAYIREFDVAVLPTRENTEHCSNSILEYMASCKPVVTTRVGGNPELVQDGINGSLVEPCQPEALAAQIEKFLDQPEYSHRAGLAGRKRIEADFQIQAITDRFVDLWLQVGRCG